MILEPLQDRVLVKRDTVTMYHGVIHLPENRIDKPQIGTIHATGGGRVTDDGKHQEPLVKPGDRIMFGKYSGTDLKIGDDEFIIMREGDILGVIHDDGE